MHKMRINKKLLALCLVALPLSSVAQQRAVTGPLESVQDFRQAITVLGQTFTVNSATRFAVGGTEIPFLALSSLTSDQDIYVEGHDEGDNTFATLVSVSPAGYVSGATPVYVLGTVEEVAREKGLIRLQSLLIDSSTLNPDLLATLSPGSLIEITGIQPLVGGKIVGAELLSVGGSGFQSRSVGGSGTQRQSVGGSGIQSQSVGGSGIQLLSVGGSGIQTQSVGGSGIQRKSVGGSGTQKLSVGGSGAQIQSVGGSGK